MARENRDLMPSSFATPGIGAGGSGIGVVPGHSDEVGRGRDRGGPGMEHDGQPDGGGADCEGMIHAQLKRLSIGDFEYYRRDPPEPRLRRAGAGYYRCFRSVFCSSRRVGGIVFFPGPYRRHGGYYRCFALLHLL